MNRTEKFSIGVDDETDTNDLACESQITVVVRNSDTYYTVQKEVSSLDEDYSFIYVSEIELLNNNSSTKDNYNDASI